MQLVDSSDERMEALDDAISALNALDTMLTFTLGSGKHIREHAFGVHLLFQQQTNALRNIAAALNSDAHRERPDTANDDSASERLQKLRKVLLSGSDPRAAFGKSGGAKHLRESR